ncbi:hypothetical protein HPB51_010462 [Rhipicephalus microplus]|uniref:Uncharacterized protein n=1 Tax=Rhipicephalus microplus TaxID=6941 RepID=A0A9J6E1C2_RHIMP|nr:hypothetical protein HPB51_010462 [Rhipicephalus microplus]
MTSRSAPAGFYTSRIPSCYIPPSLRRKLTGPSRHDAVRNMAQHLRHFSRGTRRKNARRRTRRGGNSDTDRGPRWRERRSNSRSHREGGGVPQSSNTFDATTVTRGQESLTHECISLTNIDHDQPGVGAGAEHVSFPKSSKITEVGFWGYDWGPAVRAAGTSAALVGSVAGPEEACLLTGSVRCRIRRLW